MSIAEQWMKISLHVGDVMSLLKKFEQDQTQAMQQFVEDVRSNASVMLSRLMDSEIDLFLGREATGTNKRNGYTVRTYAVRGLGTLQIKVPRDRLGKFESKVLEKGKRYDQALEKDIALLHLAGLSSRMLSYTSRRVLGFHVSPQEVSNSLRVIVPAAKAFLERPLNEKQYKYLYIDGTGFNVRRTTVEREPVLVVIGVGYDDKKSIISLKNGDKDSKKAWQEVFRDLKERGLDGTAIQLVVMDGLPGLKAAVQEAFIHAKVARCWVHKLRNVMSCVPRRYQAEFKPSWDKMAYARDLADAEQAYVLFKAKWGEVCGDAVTKFEKDKAELFEFYNFPAEYRDALRTTNPIERVNKELKRRSKSMDSVGPETLKALLAFTALRLEFGWSQVAINSPKLSNLKLSPSRVKELDAEFGPLTEAILN